MGKPICPNQGIAFAFPDLVRTTVPVVGEVPVPFPNTAQLAQAEDLADQLMLGPGGLKAILLGSSVQQSAGAEAATGVGVLSGTKNDSCEVSSASATVLYGGRGVARFGDTTTQNSGNATGSLLGTFSSVLVGD